MSQVTFKFEMPESNQSGDGDSGRMIPVSVRIHKDGEGMDVMFPVEYERPRWWVMHNHMLKNGIMPPSGVDNEEATAFEIYGVFHYRINFLGCGKLGLANA